MTMGDLRHRARKHERWWEIYRGPQGWYAAERGVSPTGLKSLGPFAHRHEAEAAVRSEIVSESGGRP